VFKHRIERDGAVPGAGPWEAMMSRDFGGLAYEAWRRTLPVRAPLLAPAAARGSAGRRGRGGTEREVRAQGNKTEYKSVTVASDATAEEFMDFYLDDPTRPKWVRAPVGCCRRRPCGPPQPPAARAPCAVGERTRPPGSASGGPLACACLASGQASHRVKWFTALAGLTCGGRAGRQDSMISETEVLENGDGRHRCQVVRWMRTFPFSFISKREYVIARRMWRGDDGALYGITKVRAARESACREGLHVDWCLLVDVCSRGAERVAGQALPFPELDTPGACLLMWPWVALQAILCMQMRCGRRTCACSAATSLLLYIQGDGCGRVSYSAGSARLV